MFNARRSAFALVLSLCAATAARAGEISSADLQIQGVGLKVVTVSATTGLDIPAAIQTEFGGKQNDAAPVVEGLLAVGELSGPGIEVPIRLEAAPGHQFRIPGLSREGVYFLQNIRLMKGDDFLQSATPAVATITVSNLLQTSVRVTKLTPEDLRARGITIDARNYDVYEYTFSFLINGQVVEIPFPVIVDPRTHEVRPLPQPVPYSLPPVSQVLPPRWQPPDMLAFEIGPAGESPSEPPPAASAGGGGGRPSIPAALIIPNSMAVLHQFFAVTLMVTNGAPDGSEVRLDGVTATIKPPAPLRTVKSLPSVAFGQPVPIHDAANGVTFLVAQARGEAEWTMEGLQAGTHTIEVDVRATYKAPGQVDFPMKGTARASIVVHDARFNINFSHPDTVREGLDYTTFSFVTNMSGAEQHIKVSSGLPACATSPGANVCRVDGTPEFHDLSIPAGEMRTIEYKLRSSVTGSVFATAGSVSDDAISAAVQLHMGVSESGIPLSPATLVMPHYARYVSEPMVSANLQLLGLGYSLATAPLTPALAKHPNVIKTDVFHRAVDIARAGQRVFLGEPMRDSLAHMAIDLLGNTNELREWDELRRAEKSGRLGASAIARELETHATGSQGEFADAFAKATAWRAPYLLAVSSNGKLAMRGITSNARIDVASEAESGWVRQLPFAELNTFKGGELVMSGRWIDEYELTLTAANDGALALDVILPAAAEGSVIRGHADITAQAGQIFTVRLTKGATALEVRTQLGAIAAMGTLTSVTPDPVRLIGARQDMHLDVHGHKVSILWNRPVGIAPGDDLLAKLSGQVVLNRDGVSYTGPRPISSAALQDGSRIANATFDHALSRNATYTMNVAPLVDPLSGATVSFPDPLVPVIDNDAPGGILFGHVLKGDNTPVANAEVRLILDKLAPQYDLSRASDGAFLFEFVPRDIDNGLNGNYRLEAVSTDDKVTSLDGAVRLPGRVHFVNLVFLGRGAAEGYVRYDNGEVVPEAKVTIGSTMFDQFRYATTDANGFYSIGDLPVGPLTFSATDADGNVTYAASEIKTPGQLLQKDLSIFRRPFPGMSTVRGVVRRSDTNAAVPFAGVGVYSQGYGLVDGVTDAFGRFEFTKIPSGFITVLAAEWSVSREATALDFDVNPDEVRDLTLVLNVKPADALVVLEGDVTRENPLFPGDASKYERVPGALVKIESGQAVTADSNGHFVFPSVPVSFANKKITAYDPITTRSATVVIPQLDPTRTNVVPIFISTADGYGKGTIRVRVLSAAGLPVGGYRVIVPGFPPEGPTPLEEKTGGVYELKDVHVGALTTIWAIGNGSGLYGDQTATGNAKVEFNGHVAALTLRLPGQGIVRTKLAADIDVIGDVDLVYPVWDEAIQNLGPAKRTASTVENGQAGYANFNAVPALQNFTVSSAHPVYGYASQSTKLGFDGDVASITLQLNKLSTVRGVVYAVDGRTPIPGAAVRIEDGRQNPGVFTSLPDGSFEFRNVAAGVSFRVIADITQEGVYRTGVASGVTPALGGPVNNVGVIMRTQGGIDGRIVYAGYKVFDPQNPANNVIDNTPADLTDNAPVPLANFALKELDFPYRDFGVAGDWITADIAGRFTINNIFTGSLRVTAVDPQNQDIRGTWTGKLTLEGERVTAYVGIGATGFGPVVVRVVDPNNQNAGVANAEVTLIRDRDVFDLSSTDGTGTARFADVPVGTKYKLTAYSKALGKSGATGEFTVVTITGATQEIVLSFSGKVDGTLTDPEDANHGVPGAQVTLKMTGVFETRASTDTAGVFLFEGVREGTFTLDAKDPLSNRRAFATRNLSQADPNPFVALQLEPTETLHVGVYLPNDAGANSNILAPLVNVEVHQRNDDYFRALQGNSFAFEGALENEKYSIKVDEVGGARRTLSYTGNFPKGSASDPLKLVLPAFGAVEVTIAQGGNPAANAKVTVSGGGKSVVVYADSAGIAVANGIPLGAAYVQAVSADNAFSGSASTTVSSQSNAAKVTITLGAYAGITGLVEAETGGPSAGTRVIASFSGRVLEMLTDSAGRYTFQGIPTSTTVSLTYMGPNDVTVGARQTVSVAAGDASRVIPAPTVKLDATPPLVTSIFPADGSNNVSPDSSLKVVFSERVQPQFISTAHIQLIPADSTTPVATTFTTAVNPDGTFSVTARPPNAPAGQAFPLQSNTLYRIVISGQILDLTGNKMPAPRGASFITSDYAEPQVVKVTPPVTSALQPATVFEFRFNEPIDPAPFEAGGNGQFHLYKISAAGTPGTVLAEKGGRAFVDPANGLTLFFTPNDPIEQESFYRVVFSGVRDLQGNPAAAKTYHFFSYDLVKPVVNLISPVPQDYPLISGVEYILGADIRNGSATGSVATDTLHVDYFRVEGSAPVFISRVATAPFQFRFVAPDVPPAGSTLTYAAAATDLSRNEGDQSSMTWQVRPNAAPQNVAIALTPATSIYPGHRANAVVTFEDEGTFAALQIEARGTNRDGTSYVSTQVRQLTRAKVNDPWPAAGFDFDLPATLAGGGTVAFKATVTDVRGLKGEVTTDLDLLADTVAPEVLSMAPAAQTQYRIGDKFTASAAVKDLETGIAEAVFSFDNKTIRIVAPSAQIVKTGTGTYAISSGQITVPAKNVDTVIPITITVKDYDNNVVSRTTEVVYIGVNDPTVPKGAWLCPVDRATYPANQTFPIKLQARASDDIAVTGVKFIVPGVTDPINATRVGTSDVYEATTPITTGAAGTPLQLTVVISDADPTHDLTIVTSLELVAVDVTVENRIQAVTAADAATYTNKSILVRGATAKFIPHIPLTLKHLMVLDGGRVETLSSTTTVEQRLDLNVTGNVSVDCASVIDVTARGYLGGWGVNSDGSGTRNDDMRGRTVGNTFVGGPSTYAGASHGGVGGETNTGVTNATYGSIANPTDLGTGGGGGTSTNNAGGSGGGAIKLQAGVLSIAGAIRADGAARAGDGNPGSGGSINISAAQLIAGPNARISANGGDDDGANNASRGAGGGRVAISTLERFDVETVGVQIQSRGGRNDTSTNTASHLDGGSGTIFVRRPGQTLGELFVSAWDDRAQQSLHLTRPTPLDATNDLRFDRVTLGPRALVRADASIEINGVVDDRTAAVIDATAVLVLQNDVPEIQVTTIPAPAGSIVQAGTLGVNYVATSAAGIGAVTLAWTPVTPNRVDSTFSYPPSSAPATINLAVPAETAPGAATLTLSALDRAGRSKTLAPLAYSIVANTPPVLTKFDVVPATLSFYPGATVVSTVSAQDDLKVTRVTFTSTIGTGTPSVQTFTPSTQPVTDRVFNVAVPITTPGGQTLTLDVVAEDAFPARPPATQQKVLQILRDANPPLVTLNAPAANALFNEGTGNTITINTTITDAEVAVKDAFVQIGDGAPVALNKSGNTYSAVVPVPPVEGTEIVTRTLTITARDYENNAGTKSIDIRIQPVNDPNAPSISWVCTTSGAMYPASYTTKLRVFALGNTVGNTSNGIQKVEVFVGEATTPILATAVPGVANTYEAPYPIPADAVDGTVVAVRAVATNASGLTEQTSTSFTVVAGQVLTADTTIAATDTSYDNKTVIVRTGTTTILGAHTFTRLIVLDGAKVTHPAADANNVHRLTFTATDAVFVSCTGSIDASARGLTGTVAGTGYTYDRVTGKPTLTGGSTNFSGGSHGGHGGVVNGVAAAPYGSMIDPNEPGGSGAHAGSTNCATNCRAGGGVIRFTTPLLHLDGTILANGQQADGSGAGGSIRIDAETIRGGGEIRADGGTNPSGASGGGGRVAIYHRVLSIPSSKITAAALQSSTANNTGAAGTIYLHKADASGSTLSTELVADNLGRATPRSTMLINAGTGTITGIAGSEVTLSNAVPFDVEGTWLQVLDANGEVVAEHAIVARTATTVTLAGNITFASGSAYRGSVRADRIISRGSAILESSAFSGQTYAGATAGVIRTPMLHSNGDVTLESGANVEVNGTLRAANLALRSATLTHTRANTATINRLTVDVTGTVSVDATSAIDVSTRGLTGVVSGTGYTYDNLTGKPTLTGGSSASSPGSHGGQGAIVGTGNSAATFGSVFEPNTPGSAGGFSTSTCSPCRSGGGVAHLFASNIALDGKILANGETALEGPGAGGSILIDAGSISGAGEIRADGGTAPSGNSAGGGRIAIYYDSLAIPATKISAYAWYAGTTSNANGAAGTIYRKASNATSGDLIVDNGNRTTARPTRLVGVGYSTLTEASTDLLRDANATYPAQDQLVGVHAIARYNRTKSWPITANDDKSLRIDVSGTALDAAAGDPLRGLYRFANVKLRNARLDTIDLLESANAIDKDTASVVVGNNQAPPVLDMSRVTLAPTATGAAVTGTAGAIVDTDTPVTVRAKNLRTGNIYVANAAPDGAFAVPVQGNAGDAVTVWARDGNAYPLETPVFDAGTLASTTPTPSQVNKTAWTTDANFIPRTLSRDGAHLAVASMLTTNGASDRLVILSVADPAHPTLVRQLNTGFSTIGDVVVQNGWAYIASDRLVTLDLTNPTAVPIGANGDPCGREAAIALVGGYAFTSETACYHDGRLNIWDVSIPSAPRYVRTENVSNVGGIFFTDLHALGSDYLVAISPHKLSNVGQDVWIIDRRDLLNLEKVASLDIPNFDAFRAKLVDDTLYVVSQSGASYAIVDVSNPTAPVLRGSASIPAPASGVTAIGRDGFAAAGTSGLVTMNVANPASPLLTGTTAVGGVAMDVAIIGAYAYVANEIGVALVPAQVAPDVNISRISKGLTGTTVSITGAPQSVTGNMPITLELINTTNGARISGLAVQGDGSFTATLPAAAGDALTITATDAFNLVTGPLTLGTVPFGSSSRTYSISPTMSDASFVARNVATFGKHLAVTSYTTTNGSSDKIVLYDITDRANPVYTRTLGSGASTVGDAIVRDGWLYVAADRLVTFDLNAATPTPILANGDPCGREDAMEIVGGFAFTAEVACYHDGRLNIWDVSTPSAPRYLRTQNLSVGGHRFTGLTAFGTDYLIAISGDKPGNIGRDIMVIDRRDVYNLRKVVEFDIPNFDGFRGKVVGNRVYVTGVNGGMAVVDLTNPAQPALVGIVTTPGNPRSVDAIGTLLGVADGSAGATFVDISPAGMPSVLGNQPTGGTAWDSAFNGATLYLANEQGLAVIDNLGTAPLIDRTLITTSSDGATGVTVIGTAKAVLGLGPMVLELRNVTGGVVVGGVAIAADGSFTTSIAGVSGDALTVKVTDSVGRVSGPLTIGTVPFGTITRSITISAAMSDAGFMSRNVAVEGKHLIVSSYPDTNGTSDKLVMFDVTTPGVPTYVRTLPSGASTVSDVKIKDGWAYVAADRLVMFDLNATTPAPILANGDPCGRHAAVEIAGGYVYMAEAACYHDGRLDIYDASVPTAPRYVRSQQLSVGGHRFTGLASLGTDYLLAFSPDKPGSIGRDIMVIDRRDVYNLRKVVEFDIPNFDAFRGKVVGNRAYLAGVTGGLAIVDLTNPAAPVVVSVLNAAGAARGVDVAGSTVAVANGSNGISFIDTRATPQVIGAHPVPGSAWDVALSRGAMYVASELGLTAVAQVGINPMIAAHRIAVAPTATQTTVSGATDAITGIAPIAVRVTNTDSGASSATVTVNEDGSFLVSVAAAPGATLVLEATDVVNRVTTRTLGTKYGPTQSTATNVLADTNYRPRRVATNGQYTIVTTGLIHTLGLAASDKMVFFPPQSATSQTPVIRASGMSGLTDVKIYGNHAYFTADRLGVIDLADPALTVRLAAVDPCGRDEALASNGRYVFSAEAACYNDGRFNIWDINNPIAPVHVRMHTAGIGGYVIRSLATLGTSYVIAMSPDKPGGVGRDIWIWDVTNINTPVKVVEMDIPNIDAIEGIVDGNHLYIAGGDGGVAIVDLTNPFAPVVRATLNTPGIARGISLGGPNELIVADSGGPGITFIDITNKSAPVIKGSQLLEGNVLGVASGAGEIRVAAENYYHSIVRPQE